MLWNAAPSRHWVSVGLQERCSRRVDVGHHVMVIRIAIRVVAFGESEIRQCEVARAHRLDLDAETAEQHQSFAEGHIRALAQLEVVVNLLVICCPPSKSGSMRGAEGESTG